MNGILCVACRNYSRILQRISPSLKCKCLSRCFTSEHDTPTPNVPPKDSPVSPLTTLNKYRIFKDEESPIILDIVEERLKALQTNTQIEDKFEGLNLARGKEGVFDIEDIVGLLKREKAQNLCVVKIPMEVKYVDYIVIVSGKSSRHMTALAEFVMQVYKKKRNKTDSIPKIEGQKSSHWIALDLGNIALHIFSNKTRPTYDIEALWAVGSQYDELCQQAEDPVIQLLQKHSVYLGDLDPSNDRQC